MSGIPASHHTQAYQTAHPGPNSVDVRLAAEASRAGAAQSRTAAKLQTTSLSATAAAHTSAAASNPPSRPVNPNLGNHINVRV